MLSLKFYLVYLYFQWHRQVINWFLNQQLGSRSLLVAIMVLELSLFFHKKRNWLRQLSLGNKCLCDCVRSPDANAFTENFSIFSS